MRSTSSARPRVAPMARSAWARGVCGPRRQEKTDSGQALSRTHTRNRAAKRKKRAGGPCSRTHTRPNSALVRTAKEPAGARALVFWAAAPNANRSPQQHIPDTDHTQRPHPAHSGALNSLTRRHHPIPRRRLFAGLGRALEAPHTPRFPNPFTTQFPTPFTPRFPTPFTPQFPTPFTPRFTTPFSTPCPPVYTPHPHQSLLHPHLQALFPKSTTGCCDWTACCAHRGAQRGIPEGVRTSRRPRASHIARPSSSR